MSGYFQNLALFFKKIIFTLLVLQALMPGKFYAQNNNTQFDQWFDQFYAAVESPNLEPAQILIAVKKIQKQLVTINQPDLTVADLWHEIGLYYYADLADYPSALACFVRAHNIRQKLIKDAAHNDLARSAFMIGVCQKYLGNYHLALQYVRVALQISTKGQNAFMLAKECLELGDIFDYLSDYEHSIAYCERAYPHILRSQREKELLLEEYFTRLAQTYLAKGAFQLALQKNQQAILLCQNAMNEALADHLHAVMGGCYTNMNLSYRAMQRYDSADYCLQKALYHYQQSDLPYVERHIGNVYNELGELYLVKKNHMEALKAQQKAIAILAKYHQHHNLSAAYASMGEVLLQERKPNEALSYFRRALRIVVPFFPGSVKEISTPTDKCLIALHGIARCQLAQQKLNLALYNFQRLDTLLNQLRHSLKEDGSKFSLAKQALPIYENAIVTALALNDTLAALNFCERNKAIVLRQALLAQQAQQAVPLIPELQQKETHLRNRLLYWQQKVLDAEDEKQKGIKQDSLARIKTQFELFIGQLEKKYPQYHRLKYAQLQVHSLSEIQKKLPHSTLCIEYFLGQNHLYLFAFSQHKYQVFQQKISSGFIDSIELQLRLCKLLTPDQRSLHQLARLSHQAYQFLLSPVLTHMNPHGQIKRLQVVPDGILHYLPFEALLETPVVDLKAQSASFLIKKYAISYKISLQDSPKKATHRRAKYNFGGFGITYASVDTRLASLPLAEQQVTYLQQNLGGKCWTHSQGQATKKAFLHYAPSCYLLHLSTHGLINELEPAKSALLLANGEKIEALTALEIYNLPLHNNALTVLAACDTGNGQLQQGEGIMSLSRAFTYAGCKSLVMSLWSLQDVYTDDLLKVFYAELQKGTPKDLALQKAKLQYLNQEDAERRAPNYWAALVLSGEVESLKFGGFNWVLFIGIILLSLLILVLLRYRFKFF